MLENIQNRREKIRIKLIEDINESEHYHRDIELLFVIRGNIKIGLGDEGEYLSEGRFFILNSMQKHTIQTLEESNVMRIYIEYALVRDIIGEDKFFFENHYKFEDASYIAVKSAINDLLYYYVETNSSKVDFAYLSYCYNILDKLTSFLSQDNPSLNHIEKNNNRVREISNYVELNYSQPISLQSLADYLFLSPTYLSKYFKKEFGLNFKQYITNYRLEKAYQEIIYTKKSLANIAFEVGFPNKQSFLKVFEETYGKNPKEYRNERTSIEQGLETFSDKDKEIIENYLKNEESKQNKQLVIKCSASKVDTLDELSQRMLNIGEAESLLSSRLQKQLILMKQEFGVKNVRIWNIFTQGMLVTNVDGELIYNFSKINAVFDFLVDHDFFPHIELTERSKFISKRIGETIKIDTGKNNLSSQALSKLLSVFLKHVVKRYGVSTIEKWRFELWIGDIKQDSKHFISDYLERFSMIYKICKGYSNKILVGGPGYSEHYSLSEQIWKFWSILEEAKPDFISLSCYNYIVDKENVEFGNTIRDKNMKRVSDEVDALKSILKKYKMADIPLWVTEWNLTISDRNFINDSCFKGCYILENILMNSSLPLSYHYLSDFSSEYYDSGNFIFGGLGLIANEDIIKPSGYAYSFINQLYDYCIDRNNDYIVTTDLNDNYSIIIHNRQELSDLYYATDENELDISDIPSYFENKKKTINLSLSNVRTGVYKVKTKSISPNKGNLINTWKQLSFYQDLSPSDIEYIKSNAIPSLSIMNTESVNNTISLAKDLESNEFILIKIKRI